MFIQDVTFCVFGDSGYGVTPSIQTPFRRGPGQTRDEAEWNRRMSSYRITVLCLNQIEVLHHNFTRLSGG